jgi:NAD(P)-dependent dehydrogenase (short-subunit alcohol dehydrogenase family)
MESVVIGAASGMGTAVARRLASRGPMVIADRDREPLERLAAELGGDVEVAGCDITRPDQVEKLFAGLDSVTSLVVTAGIAAVSGAPGRQIFEANLRGMRRVLDAFDPLVQEGTAAVCFASAGAYLVPDTPEVLKVLDDPLAEAFYDDLAAVGVDFENSLDCYNWSKKGVKLLVRRMAASWGARGARILALSPGAIDTPMGRDQAVETPIMLPWIEATPAGRWADADEVAAVTEFLTSSGASFMTGSEVLVDGGSISMAPPY